MRSSGQRRRRTALGVLALVAVWGVVAATPAAAAYEEDKPAWTSEDPKDGSNAAAEIMSAQLPLVEAAQRFTDLDAKFPGLGGVRLQVEERTLELWWKGEAPAEIREEIARAESELGIRIALGESKYTQRELVEAAAAVIERAEAYPGLTRVGPLPDGSGLEVATSNPEAAGKYEFAVAATVVKDEEQIQPYSRANDFAPWWGGAQLRGQFAGAGGCSTGFAVARYFLWWETARGILTAEHCMPGGGLNFTDPTGELIGRSEPAPARRLSDSLFVTTRSGARIYDGGVGVGEFSKPVVGAVSNFPGQFVCTSGGFTGVHCNIRTNRINQLVQAGFSFVDVVSLGNEVSGRAAAGPGDSGGPVFTLTADFSKVRAAGLIVGGTTPVSCGSFGTGCGNVVAWVDISWVLIAQQASLVTS